jgi:hypothetical protein
VISVAFRSLTLTVLVPAVSKLVASLTVVELPPSTVTVWLANSVPSAWKLTVVSPETSPVLLTVAVTVTSSPVSTVVGDASKLTSKAAGSCTVISTESLVNVSVLVSALSAVAVKSPAVSSVTATSPSLPVW